MGFLNAILYLNQFEFEEKSRLTWVFGPMPNLSSEIPLEEEKFRSLDGFIMPSNNGHSRALKIALYFSMWADISALAIISTGDFILNISRCAGETSAVKWHPSEWINKWKEMFVCVENYVAHIRMKNCINQKKMLTAGYFPPICNISDKFIWTIAIIDVAFDDDNTPIIWKKIVFCYSKFSCKANKYIICALVKLKIFA